MNSLPRKVGNEQLHQEPGGYKIPREVVVSSGMEEVFFVLGVEDP